MPSENTVIGWHDKTPGNFLFSLKFPKSIVHCGDGPLPDGNKILTSDETYRERDLFLARAGLLDSKLGYLLIQFPYFSKKVFSDKSIFMGRLDRFLDDLPADFRYAVEIRNKSWIEDNFTAILRKHNCALTMVDHSWMPMPDELEKRFDPVTADFCYCRLLGDRKEIEAVTQRWDRTVINREENLKRWGSFLARIRRRQIPVVIYANNHYSGFAPATVQRLQQLYAQARVDIQTSLPGYKEEA